MSDPLDLDHLSRVCAGTTAGEWEAIGRTVFPIGEYALSIAVATQHRVEAASNAAFIAAFNPLVIAALLAGYRARGEALEQMIAAIDGCQIDSPELDGDPDNGIPPHKWHEEWKHYALAALSLPLKTETR